MQLPMKLGARPQHALKFDVSIPRVLSTCVRLVVHELEARAR